MQQMSFAHALSRYPGNTAAGYDRSRQRFEAAASSEPWLRTRAFGLSRKHMEKRTPDENGKFESWAMLELMGCRQVTGVRSGNIVCLQEVIPENGDGVEFRQHVSLTARVVKGLGAIGADRLTIIGQCGLSQATDTEDHGRHHGGAHRRTGYLGWIRELGVFRAIGNILAQRESQALLSKKIFEPLWRDVLTGVFLIPQWAGHRYQRILDRPVTIEMHSPHPFGHEPSSERKIDRMIARIVRIGRLKAKAAQFAMKLLRHLTAGLNRKGMSRLRSHKFRRLILTLNDRVDGGSDLAFKRVSGA